MFGELTVNFCTLGAGWARKQSESVDVVLLTSSFGTFFLVEKVSEGGHLDFELT